MPNIKLSHQAPMLPVHDILLTLQFYQAQLGFDGIWTWDDPPAVASASRDNLTMLFTSDGKKAFQSTGMDIMIFLQGVEHLYYEYQAKNLKFASPLEEKPWGLKEFSLLDVNGYYLRFAENT